MKNIWQVDLEEALERLAEVEAERDASCCVGTGCDGVASLQSEMTRLRARLAAVEALAFEINTVDYSDTRIERIRAVVRGEGDRPAAHRTEWWDADDFADPERGEGDRD